MVAAFGIAAGAVEESAAEGKGAASIAGILAEAEAVCDSEGRVVVLGHVAAAGISEGNTGRSVPSTHCAERISSRCPGVKCAPSVRYEVVELPITDSSPLRHDIMINS